VCIDAAENGRQLLKLYFLWKHLGQNSRTNVLKASQTLTIRMLGRHIFGGIVGE
jgi:hypothetical protein